MPVIRAWAVAAVGAIQARFGHATIAETMDTYGHLFPESEDLSGGAVDDALASALAEQERNRSAR